MLYRSGCFLHLAAIGTNGVLCYSVIFLFCSRRIFNASSDFLYFLIWKKIYILIIRSRRPKRNENASTHRPDNQCCHEREYAALDAQRCFSDWQPHTTNNYISQHRHKHHHQAPDTAHTPPCSHFCHKDCCTAQQGCTGCRWLPVNTRVSLQVWFEAHRFLSEMQSPGDGSRSRCC